MRKRFDLNSFARPTQTNRRVAGRLFRKPRTSNSTVTQSRQHFDDAEMEDNTESTSASTIDTFASNEAGDVGDASTPTLDGSAATIVRDEKGDVDNRVADKDREFSDVFDSKRKELDRIQDDLNELMDRLNNFIADSQDELGESIDDEFEDADQQSYDDDMSEKQDGPQEKELIKQKYCNGFPVEDMYTCDGMNPPEVNWDMLAPFIQNVVGDLKKIRNLNQMTNSVLQRIKTITGNTNGVPNGE